MEEKSSKNAILKMKPKKKILNFKLFSQKVKAKIKVVPWRKSPKIFKIFILVFGFSIFNLVILVCEAGVSKCITEMRQVYQ